MTYRLNASPVKASHALEPEHIGMIEVSLSGDPAPGCNTYCENGCVTGVAYAYVSVDEVREYAAKLIAAANAATPVKGRALDRARRRWHRDN